MALQLGKWISGYLANWLFRIWLCRTASMGARKIPCQECDAETILYNSCTLRCCPVCAGARRQDWLERARQKILPGITYFQIVTTIGSSFKALTLANPKSVYRALMKASWEAINELLLQQGIVTGASAVLHTWNQQLLLHPHVHLLLPCGGLSPDQSAWIPIESPHRELLRQDLGPCLRKHFIRRLLWLHRQGKLKLVGKLAHLRDWETFASWLESIAPDGFYTFVQEPPSETTDPDTVLGYLARYIGGGPIADGRLVSYEDGIVKFRARSGRRPRAGEPQEMVTVELTGWEFFRRWMLHILPPRFYRARHYGGLGNNKHKIFLARCRKLMPPPPEVKSSPVPLATDNIEGPRCPECKLQLEWPEQDSINTHPSGQPRWEVIFGRMRCDGTVPDWFPPRCWNFRSRPVTSSRSTTPSKSAARNSFPAPNRSIVLSQPVPPRANSP